MPKLKLTYFDIHGGRGEPARLAMYIGGVDFENETEKKAARQALADGPVAVYLQRLQALLEAHGGEYFADGRLTVADLKVMVWVRSLRSGVLDHMPQDLPDTLAPLLVEHLERIQSLPKVREYYDRFS